MTVATLSGIRAIEISGDRESRPPAGELADNGVDAPIAWIATSRASIEAFLALGCRSLVPHSLGTYRSVLVRPSGTAHLSPGRFPGSLAPRPTAGPT